VPVQVENCLPSRLADVDDHTVILEAGALRSVGDELEHAFRLFRRELGDLAKRLDVPLGDDEQMRLSLRVDVADGDEPFRCVDVLAFAEEVAEEAVVRQRGSLLR
jgi:hypothetical protein